jgi:predicted CXXCH cytochrome family protein
MPSRSGRSLIALLMAAAGGCQPSPRTRDRAADAAPAGTAVSAAADADAEPLRYVGSQRCQPCHAAQLAAWSGSHHALAMQVASAATVRGDFADRSFDYFGAITRFRHDAGGYTVETEGVSRTQEQQVTGRRAFSVEYTFGVDPLQQYLVDVGDGHLQALPFAWDTRPRARGGMRWYHLHPEEPIKVGDALHWSSLLYNWNESCADCHSTGVRKQYDAATDRYDTRFAEVSVGCEACHGEGSRHVAQAERGGLDTLRGWSHPLLRVRDRSWVFGAGHPIAHLAGGPASEDARGAEVCVPCHARRTELGGSSSALDDRYRLMLLDEPAYFADGQIHDEVFEAGSFARSKMARAGVVCTDCHEPHAGTLRLGGNALCTRCHAAATFDTPRHHFHAAGSRGSACVDCHMPSRVYMGVDERHDHGFILPRPDLSQQLGVPNACTSVCHRSFPSPAAANRWAAAEIARRFGPVRPRTAAWALDAGRHVRRGGAAQLLELAGDASVADIVRATALQELRGYPETLGRALAIFARDPSELVRRTVAELVAPGPPSPPAATEIARELLVDRVRSVRLAAARALAGVPRDDWSPAQRAAFARAYDELREALTSNAGRPEALIELALLGCDAAGRPSRDTEATLRRAIALDPTFAPSYLALADFLRAADREDDGAQVLATGIAKAGDVAPLAYALGLSCVRRGDRAAALAYLRRAYELAPRTVTWGHGYAVALYEAGERRRAIALLEQLHARADGDVRVLATLSDYQARAGNRERARALAAELEAAVSGSERRPHL